MSTSTWQWKLIVTCTIKVDGPKAKVVDYDETFMFYAAGSITRLGKKLSHAFYLLKECLSERFQTFSVVDDRIKILLKYTIVLLDWIDEMVINVFI